ncbi:hypothetical protein FB446DRAFT_703957 [Lentinula raphanica]|nr:hypothetical protein FB446DRAFT_703957 [Lentinula raphanica]
MESEVDIELYEWDIIRTNPTVYNCIKDKLKSHTLAWIDERNREDSKQPRAREDYTEPTPKRMRFMEEIPLEEVDITQCVLVTIPEDLCQLAMSGQQIPLCILTENNLRHDKLSHLDGSPRIINISDILQKIKDLPGKAGPYCNQDLSFNGWIEATQNMFNLISSCFRSGEKSPEAIYFKQWHMSFFENQTNSADLTGLWLEHEIELCEEHHIKPSAYNPLKYSSIWTCVEAKWDTIRQQARLLDLDSHIPIPELICCFNAGILSYPSFSSTFHNPFSKLSPFSQNSWENDDSEEELVNLLPSIPCCIGCRAVGHTLAGHKYAEHRGLQWATLSGQDLLTPTSPITSICIHWNEYGKCDRNCSADSHVCSLCGEDHWALQGH